MTEIIVLTDEFEGRVRLLAAEIADKTWTIRHREIRRAAGRLHEEFMSCGRQRWEAVQAHDEFIACATARLNELDRQRKEPSHRGASVTPIRERKSA